MSYTDLRLVYTRSDKDTHFTGAINQNAVEYESINLPSDLQSIKIVAGEIKGISIQSDQNLEWDVFVFSNSTTADTDLDLDTFIEYANFPTTSGKQIAGAGQYYYAVTGLEIPYVDEDNDGKIHIGLVNRSATAKNAGATGEVVVNIMFKPLMI